MRSPVQPVKYVCAVARRAAREPGDEEEATTIESARRSPFADRRRRSRASRGTAARARSASRRAASRARAPCGALYGAVSRASVAMRRAVVRHDQSSTCAALHRRCEPACQTLTRAPRPVPVPGRTDPCASVRIVPSTRRRLARASTARRTRARAGRARRSRGRPGSSASSSSCVPRAAIAPAVEHDELVGERDRREAVRDDQRRPPAHRLAQAEPDPRLGRRVDRRGRVVEDQDPRVDDRAPARSRSAAAARRRA